MSEQPDWKPSDLNDRIWGGCRLCRHFRPDFTCVSYPQRIPLIIASGEVDHLVVRPGQVGDTVFELNPQPTGLALRFLRHAAARGASWAVDALTTIETSAHR
jgi:hypothetical protein